MERRYILTSTHTTTVHPYNDPATRAAATDTLRPDGLHVPFHDVSDECRDVRVDATFHAASPASRASHKRRYASHATAASHAVRAAESAAPRPARRGFTQRAAASRLSRRAAGLLFFLVAVAVNLSSPVRADETLNTGKVRYAFELKKISAEEAKRIFTSSQMSWDDPNGYGKENGTPYVDLYMYVYFDKNTFAKYFYKSGDQYVCDITPNSPDFSFFVTNLKGGTSPDVGMSVAKIAPKANQPRYNLSANAFWVTPTFQEPDWDGYEVYAKSVGKSGEAPVGAIEIENREGEDFFRVRIFKVRFYWTSLQPASFYVSPYCGYPVGVAGKGGATSGSTTCQIDDADNTHLSLCGTHLDWVIAGGENPAPEYQQYICTGVTGGFAFIQGGVEIISGFEGEITPRPDTVCPGTDANLKVTISRFKSSSTTWNSNLTQASVQYKKNGVWSQAVGVGAAGAPYFKDTTNGNVSPTGASNATEVTFVVPPTWPGTSYDSLRLNLTFRGEGENNAPATYRLPFEVRYYESNLYTAFADVNSTAENEMLYTENIGIYGKKSGVNGDKDTIVGISSVANVVVFPADKYKAPFDKKYTTSGLPENGEIFNKAIYGGVKNVELWYAKYLSDDFIQVTSANTEKQGSEHTSWYTVTKPGYYYLSYHLGNCDYYTDTVYVKVLQPPTITISTGTNCEKKSELKVEAMAPGVQATTGWEWVLADAVDIDFETHEYVPFGDPMSSENTTPWVRIPDETTFKAGGELWAATDEGAGEDVQILVLNFRTSSEGNVGQFVAEPNSTTKTLIEDYNGFTGFVEDDAIETLGFLEMSEEDPYVQLAMWPAQANAPAGMKFSDNYAPQFLAGKVFYARYWVGTDTSAWGYAVDFIDDPAKKPIGISATECVSDNYKYRGTGEVTSKEVDPGDDVTLRCYVDMGAQSDKKVGITLFEERITIYWQVSTDDGATWTTWYTSGYGLTDDDGELIGEDIKTTTGNAKTLYIEATRKNITKTEKHRVYAVFGTCEYHPWDECNKIHYGINCDLPKNQDIGDYDTVCTITVAVGKLEVAKTGTNDFDRRADVCHGDKIDLKLSNTSFPAGTQLSWQMSVYGDDDDENWIEIASSNTTTLSVVPGIPAAWKDMEIEDGVTLQEYYDAAILEYDGFEIYYRVKAAGFEDAPVGNVTVAVRKAPKVKINGANLSGVHKSPEAGYCAGETIRITPVQEDGSAVDPSLSYAYQQVDDLDDFMAPVAYEEGIAYKDYENGSGGGFHRIVMENTGCYGYSDTVQVVIRPAVKAKITGVPGAVVCSGTKVTLTGGETPLEADETVTYIWTYGPSFTLKKEETKVDTFAATFPVNGTNKVRLDITKFYGDPASTKEEDKTTCSSNTDEVTINTKICKPILSLYEDPGEDGVARITTICVGSTYDLAWTSDDDDNLKTFDCGTDKLYYATEPGYTSYQEVSSSDYTCQNLTENGVAYATILTLKSTSSITNTPGKYKFKGAKNGMGAESDPTAVLTVKAAPEIDEVVLKLDTICEGTTTGAKAEATVKPKNGSTGDYTYVWYKNGTKTDSLPGKGASNTKPIVGSGSPAPLTDNGTTYKVRVTMTSSGCVSAPVEKEATFVVNPLPTAAEVIMGKNDTVCAGTEGHLTATINNRDTDKNTYEYTWKIGTGAGSDVSGYIKEAVYRDLTATAPNTGADEYYLSVTAITKTTPACSTSSVVPTKAKIVAVTCSGPSDVGVEACKDDTVKTFKLVCPSGADAIVLTESDGTTVVPTSSYSLTPSPSPTVKNYYIKFNSAPTQTKTYKAKVTLNSNTFDPAMLTYTIHPLPDFDVTVDDSKACPGATAEFEAKPTLTSDNKATGVDYTYKWYGKYDTLSYTTKKISFPASTDSANQYEAIVTAESDKGCKTTKTDKGTLTVKPLPTKPGIDPMNPVDVCANEDETITPTVQVDPTATTTTYTWYYTNDGSTPNASNGQPFTGKDLKLCHNGAGCTTAQGVNMGASGTIKACLKITSDLDGCKSDSMGPVVTINVNPKPTVAVTVADKTVCAGASHTFVPTGMSPDPTTYTNYIYVYRWTPDASAATGSEGVNGSYTVNTDATITSQKVNNYEFVFKVTTDKGCTDSVIKKPKLTVNPRTKVTITKDLADTSACEGASVSLVATASGATKYEWYKEVPAASGTWVKQTSAPNAATWTFSSVAKSNEGSYKLLAFNTASCADSAWSSVKTLTVYDKATQPVIADMTAVEFCQGETGHSLTATVTSAVQNPGSSTQNWYLTNTTGTAVGTGLTYTLPSSTYNTAGTYNYIYKQVNITDHQCKDSAQKEVKVTVIGLPDLDTVTVASDATGDKACTDLTLTATAKKANGTAILSDVTYQWQYLDGGTWKDIASATGKTYKVTTVGTNQYRCITSMGVSGTSCGKSKTSAPISVTVVEMPVINSVTVSRDTTLCEKGSVTFSVVTDPSAADVVGNYSYAWKKGSTTLSTENSASLVLTNISTSDAATYTCTVTATNDICTATKSGSATLTVTTPIDLSATKITDDKEGDTCIDKGEHELRAVLPAALPADVRAKAIYMWTKPDGSDASHPAVIPPVGESAVPGNEGSVLKVPAKLGNSGTYKVVVVIPPFASNPCTSKDSATITLRFKFCGEEDLTPGSAPEQNGTMAIICQKGNENSTASVSFNSALERDSITKVVWMKYTTQPLPNSTNDGVVVKTVEVDASTQWPLTLTHTEVFVDNLGNPESAPKNYYVRVKIYRGSAVNFSKTYRFVKAENAPKATPLSMNTTDTTVCEGTAFEFLLTATKPGDPNDAAYTGLSKSSENLRYIWTKPGGTLQVSGSNKMPATTSAAVTADIYSAKVVSAYKYSVSGGFSNTCYDTAGPVEGKITVLEPPTVSLTITPAGPVCANTVDASTTLTLSASPAHGTISKWEHTVTGSKTEAKHELSGTANPNTITSAHITKPEDGATAAVTNTYTVTVTNAACPAAVQSVNFVVNPVPALTSVVITADTAYCNDAARTLTATAKNGNTNISSGVTYAWEESYNGGAWSSAGSGSSLLIASGKAAGTYQYRCTATMSTGTAPNTCTVSKTSDEKKVVIYAKTVAGTLNKPDAVCSNVDAANYPVFTLTGNTGNVTKWEVGTYQVPGNTTTTYTLNPSDPNIAGLLSTSLRKTTLTVKVTVKNGVCPVETATNDVDIYEKIASLVLTTTVDECDLNKNNPEVSNTPTFQSTAGESISWEYVGGMAEVVDLTSVTVNTSTGSNGLDFNAAFHPTYEDDTTYTVRAKITSTVCGEITSNTVTVKALRKSQTPSITAVSPVCEGSGYTVTATRPAKSALTWTVAKDGGAATSITTSDITGQTETYTVAAADAVYGSYKYTVTDKGCDAGKSKDVTVVVNQKPVAGQIEASAGGVFCSGENVVVAHKSGTTLVAPTGKIDWQVCTDKDNYLDTKVSERERTGATATANYSVSGFAAGTYFIHYVVPAASPCTEAESDWVEVKVINAVTAPTLPALGTVCEGTDTALNFTATAGLHYQIYSNTSNANTGGTALADGAGTVGADGKVRYPITAATTSNTQSSIYYYVKVTDPTYTGGGTCGEAISATTTLKVDAKPVGGTLLFANNNKDTLTANVADHAYLQLSGAKGNPLKAFSSTQPQGGSYGSATDIGAISTSANKDVPLQVSHMEKTMFWVVAQNGVCPDANSDTVVVTVKSANDPTLGITSPICEKITDATLVVNVPETLKGSFQWPEVKWYRRAYTAGMGDGDGWQEITTVVMPTISGTPTTATATDPDARTLTPGTYQYRYYYNYGTDGYSNPATLQIDATSKGGQLTVDNAVVCEDGTSPVISLEGDVLGDIVAGSLKSGATPTTITTAVGGSTNAAHVYDVPTGSANIGKKYYQVQVKNGVCPADTSRSVAVEVIEKPVAGTLAPDNTLCYDNGTTTVRLSGQKGSSIVWSTASSQSGNYTPVPNTDQTTYTAGPSTDRIWVKVTVNTNADVCTAVSTTVDVKVYDTLKITTQPQDKTVVGSGSVSFTVAASTAGIEYEDGTGDKHVAVSAGSYQWYHSTDGGTTWAIVNNGGDYSGATTATLTVTNAQDYPNEMFYCVVTSNPCERGVKSNPAKINAMEKLVPGITKSLTHCACYYPTDPALYYVQGAAGQGDLEFRWQVTTSSDPSNTATSNDWQDLSAYTDLTYTFSDKGDTVVFPAVGAVVNKNIKWIRALVRDEYTKEQDPDKWEPATGDLIKVCEQDKPTYSFEGNIVCEREANSGGTEVKFIRTATPDKIDGREITYSYKSRSDADFVEIGRTQNPNTTVQTETVNWPGGASLTFNLSNDNLSIPATSAIPFEADSMVIRMEVRSCYTPDIDHTGKNTDTTIYVLLRVDRPVNITSRAKDTIIFVGGSFDMETGYALWNKTIPGNEITAKWYQLGKGQKDGKTYDGDKDDVAVRTFSDVQKADSGTWYVDLSTKYCPAVSDSIEVDVHKLPTIIAITSAEVCEGEVVGLKVTIDADSPDDYTMSWEYRQENTDSWEKVLQVEKPALPDGLYSTRSYHIVTSGSDSDTLTINSAQLSDAGYYKFNLVIAGTGETKSAVTTVKVKYVPEMRLDPRYEIKRTEDSEIPVKVTWTAMPNKPTCVIEATPTKYEWYAQAPTESGFSLLSGSEAFVKGNANQQTIMMVAVKDYDSTLFYAKVTTGCGDVETEWDTLRVTDQFSIENVTLLPKPACEGDTVKIVATTTAPAVYVQWQVSTDGGDTWDVISWPTAQSQYDSTWSDGTYTLTINNVTSSMEGYIYRVVMREEENGELVYSTEKDGVNFLGIPAVLHVDKPFKFTCTDVFNQHDPAVVLYGTPGQSAFTFKLNCKEGCVACKDDNVTGDHHDCMETYAYDLRKPSDNDYGNVGSASTYTFDPEELGMNYIRFSAGNHCGWDTAYDSVLVITQPVPGTVTGIPTEPGKGPDEPIEKDVEGPASEDITVEICEGNTLYLAATYTGGPAKSFHWQVGGVDIKPMASPYSLRNDTLVISPVTDDIHNKVYQCVFDMPGSVPAITSYKITVHVNHKPNLSEAMSWVSIKDLDADLDTGQALPGHKVQLTAENVPGGATQICFYQAFKNEKGEVDSVKLLSCGKSDTYELTENATVAEHDATWYYVQIYNDCGYDSTQTYQLRIFDTLNIRWIPDTLIENPTGGWDYSEYDPEPGKVVVLLRPGEDSVQVAAHLWICQNDRMWIRDTTLSGFMSSEVYSEYETENEEEKPERGSRWYYRESEEDAWKVINLNREPWVDMLDQGVDLTVQEHEGNVGFYLPATPDMDGWQFKAWGMNALYDDSTCVLTLHVIPTVEYGDLEMVPPQITACYETDAEFKVTSATADLSKLSLDWQVKPAGSDTWSDNIDTLHNDTIYTIGRVGLPYNGYEVRAIAQGACGSDTAYGKIVINTPVAPGVKLKGDSVCLGEPLLLIASDTGDAGHSKFEWYVNGELVADATGETFDMSAYAVGQYTVRVVMTADLTSNGGCVIPEKAQAEEVVIIYALPQIEAFIADTVMKNIDTTSVWVKGQGDYTYAWTPETGLFDASADSTLLWGLEPQQEPYWYKVTATDEHGCQAVDSVHVRIESNFTIDSFSIVVVVPPVLDLDDGTLPGYPDDPDKKYYPELGGSPFGGELIFRNDTVADLWICVHNTALIHFNVRGGEEPITYTWTIDDGNATLVYPVDAEEGRAYWFKEPEKDSVFGVFFPDTTTHTMYCEIYDKTGVGGRITIRVHYYRPEMFYLEVTPKVTSGKYYEQQAMNFFVRPDRDWLTTWIVVRDGEVKDTVTNRKMNRQMSFTKEEGDETSIWISTVDRHGCRIWDSVPIHIIPLPNVLLLGDPMYGVIFPEFEVEITNTWGLKVKAFEDRNGNGSSRGWDGRTKSGTYVVAGTYYYRAKVPTLDKKGYMIVNGAVTVVNK